MTLSGSGAIGVSSLIAIPRTVDIQSRRLVPEELAVVTRFLGQHDSNTITIAVMAVNRALGDPQYRRGAVVRVPLREVAASAALAPDLETLEPRGNA